MPTSSTCTWLILHVCILVMSFLDIIIVTSFPLGKFLADQGYGWSRVWLIKIQITEVLLYVEILATSVPPTDTTVVTASAQCNVHHHFFTKWAEGGYLWQISLYQTSWNRKRDETSGQGRLGLDAVPCFPIVCLSWSKNLLINSKTNTTLSTRERKFQVCLLPNTWIENLGCYTFSKRQSQGLSIGKMLKASVFEI